MWHGESSRVNKSRMPTRSHSNTKTAAKFATCLSVNIKDEGPITGSEEGSALTSWERIREEETAERTEDDIPF
jgi:hypothetical protein